MTTPPSAITRPPVEIVGRHSGYGFAGLGVSTAIGNFTQTTIDLTFPAGLLGLLDWQRTYNSHSVAIGALGPSWPTSLSARLVVGAAPGLLQQTPGTVTFHDEDGRVLIFMPDQAGGFSRPQDLKASLTRNSDGTCTLAYNSGAIWSFDSSGRLTGRSLESQQITRRGRPSCRPDRLNANSTRTQSSAIRMSPAYRQRSTDAANLGPADARADNVGHARGKLGRDVLQDRKATEALASPGIVAGQVWAGARVWSHADVRCWRMSGSWLWM